MNGSVRYLYKYHIGKKGIWAIFRYIPYYLFFWGIWVYIVFFPYTLDIAIYIRGYMTGYVYVYIPYISRYVGVYERYMRGIWA